MTEVDDTLPDCINPCNFPAKLWRMINNPDNSAICWDNTGDLVVIDQKLFEKMVLSPSGQALSGLDGFKTTNFSSFVRQLNLYGFKKPESIKSPPEKSTVHLFFNPYFKQYHPELLVNLRRLTADNKAKINAGVNVRCRPPSKYQRVISRDLDGLQKLLRDPSSICIVGQDKSFVYHAQKNVPPVPHNGTPIPPRYLPRAQCVSPPTDTGPPVSVRHPYSTAAASPFQHDVRSGVSYGNPNLTGLHIQNKHYPPGFYSPACQYYPPSLMPLLNGAPTGPYPSIVSYYQTGYPMTASCVNHQNKPDPKKADVNLDTVFQIADEVMQTQPNNNSLTKIATPEKPCCSGKQNSTNSEARGFVVSSPVQIPKDTTCEVTREDLNNSMVIQVDVCNTAGKDL